jgi:hypothetical protein
MTELVDRIVTRTGLDRTTAEKAVGIILDFLSKEGPPDKVQALLARLPGHEALIATANAEGGGLFGNVGGIMGVGSRLMGAGLSMGEIQDVIRELVAYSRDKGAADTLGDVAASIPGLSQYL